MCKVTYNTLCLKENTQKNPSIGIVLEGLPQKPPKFQEAVEPATAGEAYHVSQGSYSRSGSVSNLSSSSTSTRINRSSVTAPINKFSQIRAGLLPYEMGSDGVNVRDAIELCQKAYANVPIFRNTIDMMSEFANAELYLEGGNSTSRKFL